MKNPEFRVFIEHCFLMGQNTVQVKQKHGISYLKSGEVVCRFQKEVDDVAPESIKKMHKIILEVQNVQ